MAVQDDKPETWKYFIDECAANTEKLTDWETSFIESVSDQFERTQSLSPKQKEILERIYCKKRDQIRRPVRCRIMHEMMEGNGLSHDVLYQWDPRGKKRQMTNCLLARAPSLGRKKCEEIVGAWIESAEAYEWEDSVGSRL
jgi:hypothetical protein